MTKTFEDTLGIQLKMEMEKQLFGGNIYAMAHKFPSLYITNDEGQNTRDCDRLESFINYTKLINHIADSCGSDLALLFAESYKIYEIYENHIDQHDSKHKLIIEFCTEALAHLSLALNQSEKLLEKINSQDLNGEVNLEISGNDYCFIVMMLNNLFYYYTTIVNFILNKRYLNSEFIKSISERLCFIVSDEFESLRRMFKVIECYKEIETKPTFH